MSRTHGSITLNKEVFDVGTEINLQNLQFENSQSEKRIKKAELKKAELLRKIGLLQAGVKEPETTNEEKELLDKFTEFKTTIHSHDGLYFNME